MGKRVKNVKSVVSDNWTNTKIVAKNAFEFVDAACLGIVSGFAIYQGYNNDTLPRLWAKVLIFAGVLIAVQAFVLLVRHFNKSSIENSQTEPEA